MFNVLKPKSSIIDNSIPLWYKLINLTSDAKDAGRMFDFDTVVNRMNNHSSKWCSPEVKFKTKEERDAAKKSIPMWIADMDFKTDPRITEAVLKDISHGINGYTVRWDGMFAAFIQWISKRHGWDLERSWLDMSPGVLSAVCTSIQIFTRPGDNIILQTPIYTPFFELIHKNGRFPSESPLIYKDGKYTIDFDDLRVKASNPRTTMIILCNPHNPVGRVWTRNELEEIGRVCIENNVKVFSDEIHSDLILSGHKHVPFAMLDKELSDICITAYAPSKTFNLAGFYTSIIVTPNPILRYKFGSQMRSNGANCVCSPGKIALETAYRDCEDFVDELMRYVESNVNYLIDFINKFIPGVQVIRPEGTYLAWMDFRNCGIPVSEINRFLLCKGKVVLEYGEWFGDAYQGFARINLACPRYILEKALIQIRDAMNQKLGRD